MPYTSKWPYRRLLKRNSDASQNLTFDGDHASVNDGPEYEILDNESSTDDSESETESMVEEPIQKPKKGFMNTVRRIFKKKATPKAETMSSIVENETKETNNKVTVAEAVGQDETREGPEPNNVFDNHGFVDEMGTFILTVIKMRYLLFQSTTCSPFKVLISGTFAAIGEPLFGENDEEDNHENFAGSEVECSSSNVRFQDQWDEIEKKQRTAKNEKRD